MESAVKKQSMRGKKRELKTFLAVGPTRQGKSSFINALAGKPLCVVGKDEKAKAKMSTTSQIRAFQFDLDNINDKVDYTVQIIDTIGFWDNRLLFTDKQICEMIMEELVGGGSDMEVISESQGAHGLVRTF
jgi:septin family protein